MANLREARYMIFPREEYEQRWQRARQLMEKHGLDALLVTYEANMIYLTGYRTSLFKSAFRPLVALFPREGDAVLILPNLEVGGGEENSPIQDIRSWGVYPGCMYPDALTAIREVITEKKLTNARIGIERGTNMRMGMNLDQFEALQSGLPEVQWPNSAPMLWELRRVKSPAEVAYIAESQRICDAGYHAALDAARAGISELELQRVLGMKMMEEGADMPSSLIITSGPERYKMTNPWPSERVLQPGDMVIFDIGCVYRSYRSDITRGFFIESVTDRQREFYEAAKAITADALTAVKPGATCEDVDAVAEQSITDRGYKQHMFHRTGHSLGIDTHEMPSVAKGDKTVLEPGMVLTIEPGIYDFSIGAFRMEDLIVVTETGFEYLSHARRELTVK